MTKVNGEEALVVGHGVVVGRCGELWAVDNGAARVFIAPANMLAAEPRPGDVGVLTYEYRGLSRVACFRRAQETA